MNGETEAVFDANGSIKFFNINAGNETIGRFAPTPVDLYLSNTTLNGTYEVRRIYEILRTTNSKTVENNVTVLGPTGLISLKDSTATFFVIRVQSHPELKP